VGRVLSYVESRTHLDIRLTATATVQDMISNIGGTLGLMCGFSILSLAEAVYWLLKPVAQGVKRVIC